MVLHPLEDVLGNPLLRHTLGSSCARNPFPSDKRSQCQHSKALGTLVWPSGFVSKVRNKKRKKELKN